jgi:hypothetical protein
MSEEEYAEAIHDINDDIEEDVFFSKYCECVMAMAKLGRKQTLKYIKKISSKEEMEDFGINE